jgi:structure-specific endonuclease subunit SLX1
MWHCYLLYSESTNRTYIGITNNLDKRIKQHNQELSGGAKATKIAQDWKYQKTIQVPDKSTALSIEYQWKQVSGLEKRLILGDKLEEKLKENV